MLFIPFIFLFLLCLIWFYYQIKKQPNEQGEPENKKFIFKKRKRIRRKLGILKYRIIKKWNRRKTEKPSFPRKKN